MSGLIKREDKKLLLEELRAKFEEIKMSLGFSSTFEELNEVFYLDDYVLNAGFVSERLSRAICSRIVDTLSSWGNYLHGIVMPNPGSMIAVAESEIFSDEEKKEIIKIIEMILSVSSRNSIIGLTKDSKKEGEFIDDAMVLWNTIKPKFIELSMKINKNWITKAENRIE